VIGETTPEPTPKPTSRRSKKSNKAKIEDACPRKPSEYEIKTKAAYLWSKKKSPDGTDETDWVEKAREQVIAQGKESKHRLAVQNSLISAAWELLSEEERLPWIEEAKATFATEIPLE